MQEVIHRAERVAETKSTVLITGETGTGKELVARAIHDRSAERRMPLIKVNCAAIPETLLESELFGHVRGAFTGRHVEQEGPFRPGQRRQHLPGRDRDAPGPPAGQAAARAAGARVRAARRRTDRAGGRARDRGHQPRSPAARVRGQVPGRPLLPAQRHPDPDAAAARAPRGHPGAGRALPPQARAAHGKADRQGGGRRGAGAAALRLAGQRARAGEHHRARGGAVERARDRARRTSPCWRRR